MLTNLLLSSYIVSSILILFLVNYLYKKLFALNYWERLGVPTMKPTLPFLGNFYKLFFGKSNLDLINELHDKMADRPFAGVYAFTTPLLILKDPDLIKRVMIKDFHYFVDRGFHSNPDMDPIARNLIHMTSNDWKKFRPCLASVYSAHKVKIMIESIMEICDEVLAEVKKLKQEGVGPTTSIAVEVSDLFTRFATDCYTTNSLGFNERSVTNGFKSEFFRHGMMCLGWFFIRHVFVGTFYPRVHRLLKMGVANKEVTGYFQKLADRCMRTHGDYSGNNNENANLLQTLIAMKQRGRQSSQDENVTAEIVDEKFVAAQIYVFFIAAHDSVGNTLAFCLYELALQPELQAKVRTEIREVFSHTSDVTLQTLNDLKYTSQVLSETMRKYPVLSLVFRKCTQDYQIPGTDIILEKGTLAFVPVHSVHRDPKYYPNPEAFDPERFSEENVMKRSEGAYLPFGRGPRMCPGQVVAVTQMKLMLAKVLLQYGVSLNSKTSRPLNFDPSRFLLTPKNGIWLNFYRLSDAGI